MTIPFAGAVAVCANISGKIIARRGPRLAEPGRLARRDRQQPDDHAELSYSYLVPCSRLRRIATLVLGLASTGRWAQASARRNGERLD
jgi:hypothetical protein